jgi:F-type H+-transporting ATPase subunit a
MLRSKTMGEHQTWLDYLDSSSWAHNISGQIRDFDQQWLGGFWAMFGTPSQSLIHVFWACVVIMFVLFGAFRFRAAVAGGGQEGLIPPPRFNLRHFFELICDTTLSLMEGVMGEKAAKRFFPLIASCAFFILFSNFLALIPGMGVPTTSLRTNLAPALIIFFATHIYGVKEHGFANYLKHFMGPIPLLAPLMFPIELISHVVRPLSLAIRLLGNMTGDHKVVFTFFTLVPFFVPVPFLFLGLLVTVVQTLVFCLLSMVYISMAIAHDH